MLAPSEEPFPDILRGRPWRSRCPPLHLPQVRVGHVVHGERGGVVLVLAVDVRGGMPVLAFALQLAKG